MSKSGVISNAQMYKRKCSILTFISRLTGTYAAKYLNIKRIAINNNESVIDTLVSLLCENAINNKKGTSKTPTTLLTM